MISKFFSLPAAIIAAIFMAVPHSAHALVGQTSAGAPQSASILMVLTRSGSGAGFCSGVVLGPRIILTAAHCAGSTAMMRVHFRDGRGTPVMQEVARVVRHPLYRADAIAARARSVDLALIQTAEDLPQNFSAAAIGHAPEKLGAELHVAGFGVAREGDSATSGQLRSATLTIRAPLSNLLLWLDSANGSGACTGDSGGPVFDGSALVGIIAFAEGAAGRGCGKLTQAIRIAPHKSWIDRTIASWR